MTEGSATVLRADSRSSTHRELTVDHIIALANGGTDDMDNLQTLCKPCNSSKGSN